MTPHDAITRLQALTHEHGGYRSHTIANQVVIHAPEYGEGYGETYMGAVFDLLGRIDAPTPRPAWHTLADVADRMEVAV